MGRPGDAGETVTGEGRAGAATARQATAPSSAGALSGAVTGAQTGGTETGAQTGGTEPGGTEPGGLMLKLTLPDAAKGSAALQTGGVSGSVLDAATGPTVSRLEQLRR